MAKERIPALISTAEPLRFHTHSLISAVSQNKTFHLVFLLSAPRGHQRWEQLQGLNEPDLGCVRCLPENPCSGEHCNTLCRAKHHQELRLQCTCKPCWTGWLRYQPLPSINSASAHDISGSHWKTGDTVGFTGRAHRVLFVNKWVSWSIINTWLIGPALWQAVFLSHFSAAECISGTVLRTDLLAEAVLAEGRMFPCILCWSVWECGVDNTRDCVMALHLFLLWSDLFFLLSQQKQVSCRFLVHRTQSRSSVVKKKI